MYPTHILPFGCPPWVESNRTLGATMGSKTFKSLNGGGSPDFRQPVTTGKNQEQLGYAGVNVHCAKRCPRFFPFLNARKAQMSVGSLPCFFDVWTPDVQKVSMPVIIGTPDDDLEILLKKFNEQCITICKEDCAYRGRIMQYSSVLTMDTKSWFVSRRLRSAGNAAGVATTHTTITESKRTSLRIITIVKKNTLEKGGKFTNRRLSPMVIYPLFMSKHD